MPKLQILLMEEEFTGLNKMRAIIIILFFEFTFFVILYNAFCNKYIWFWFPGFAGHGWFGKCNAKNIFTA